jgi:hypothetical protein
MTSRRLTATSGISTNLFVEVFGVGTLVVIVLDLMFVCVYLCLFG